MDRRAILSAVQQHWDGGGTRYSSIYELKSRRMSLFNASNFDEHATFDLASELAKGERTYYIPQEYSELRLVSPADRATVAPRAVELAWAGKPGSSYQLCLGVESQVDRCDAPAVVSAAPPRGRAFALAWPVLCFGLAGAAAIRRRQALAAAFFVLVPVGILLGACGNGTAADGDGAFRRSMATLRPRTTYSWKVVARATAGGIATESVARTFTTSE